MMRYTQAEKMEVVRTVEGSELGVRETLKDLDVPKSCFYDWYKRMSGADTIGWQSPRVRRGSSGTRSLKRSASRWSHWHWLNRRGAQGNWLGRSPTDTATFFQNRASTGSRRRMNWSRARPTSSCPLLMSSGIRPFVCMNSGRRILPTSRSSDGGGIIWGGAGRLLAVHRLLETLPVDGFYQTLLSQEGISVG
jgi:hypothetical protein